MPQIIITAEGRGREGSSVYRERVNPADLESEAASLLLIERIGWAISDAEEVEHRLDSNGGEGSRSKLREVS